MTSCRIAKSYTKSKTNDCYVMSFLHYLCIPFLLCCSFTVSVKIICMKAYWRSTSRNVRDCCYYKLELSSCLWTASPRIIYIILGQTILFLDSYWYVNIIKFWELTFPSCQSMLNSMGQLFFWKLPTAINYIDNWAEFTRTLQNPKCIWVIHSITLSRVIILLSYEAFTAWKITRFCHCYSNNFKLLQ